MKKILNKIFKSTYTNEEKVEDISKIQILRCECDGKSEFKNAIEALNYVIKDYTISNIDKIIVMEKILQSIKIDLQGYYATKILYKYDKATKCTNDNERKYVILPIIYIDEIGDKKFINKCGKKKIFFSRDFVVSVPWQIKRYIDANLNIYKNVFRYHNTNHYSVYYKGLDITFIDNGYHSTFAGILNKKGYIISDVINVENLFSYIDIDENLEYFDIKSQEVLSGKIDFRIALLYKISKIKYELLKKIKKDEERYIENKDEELFFIGDYCYEMKSEFKEDDDIIQIDLFIYNGCKTFDNDIKRDIIAHSSAKIIKEFKIMNITDFQIDGNNYRGSSIADRLIKSNFDNAMYYGAKSVEIHFSQSDNYIKKDIIHFLCRNDLQYFIDIDKKTVIGYKKLGTNKSLRDIIMMNS